MRVCSSVHKDPRSQGHALRTQRQIGTVRELARARARNSVLGASTATHLSARELCAANVRQLLSVVQVVGKDAQAQPLALNPKP